MPFGVLSWWIDTLRFSIPNRIPAEIRSSSLHLLFVEHTAPKPQSGSLEVESKHCWEAWNVNNTFWKCWKYATNVYSRPLTSQITPKKGRFPFILIYYLWVDGFVAVVVGWSDFSPSPTGQTQTARKTQKTIAQDGFLFCAPAPHWNLYIPVGFSLTVHCCPSFSCCPFNCL